MDAAFFSKVRVVVIAFFVFFIYAVIVIRLWAVQVCSGEEIQQKVSRQYVRNIRIPATDLLLGRRDARGKHRFV